MSFSVPSHTQVLVIGGGPSGSYGATVLSREGIDVVLLEAAYFPRYHIGESMLPSIRHFLTFVGALEKVEKHGFAVKPGAAFKFNQFKREGYTNFGENASWNVVRSEFDEILLRHAQESGAKVFEGHKVLSLEFSSEDPNRPVLAHYKANDGTTGSITFDYLIDASGRNGIMSTKYLKNRVMNSNLKNIACWGYWENHGVYKPGTNRENAPFFESLTDESGWAWYIPLKSGKSNEKSVVSIGIVMDQKTSQNKKARGSEAQSGDYSLTHHYLDQFQFAPGLDRLKGDAKLRVPCDMPTVQSATDFSYNAKAYAGNHFRLVGDAAAFIDPFFSSGVHLAFAGGLTAAVSIAASMRGHCTEAEAIHFHTTKISLSYTRFLLVVMGAYRQMRAQKEDILSEVGEDNFDRAFSLIRPIIQGTSDVDRKMTEKDVREAIDFMSQAIINPADPEMERAVRERIPEELLSPDGKLMLNDEIDRVAKSDEEARFVLKKLNARKPVRDMYGGPHEIVAEGVDGWFIVTTRGRLGLCKH